MAAPLPRHTPSWSGPERRRFPRYNMALDVAFGPVAGSGIRPPDDQLERTVTVNLSFGGLCLYSDILYPVGAQLVCCVTLPGRVRPIQIIGPVVWFQKVQGEVHGYKLGIELRDISAEDRAVLIGLLEHPPSAEASRAKTLLLVDDDEELQLALKLRFESAGFQVLTAHEGLEALHKSREAHPDLIVLDIMLPRLDGYEVCRLLKFDPRFRHIPIVILTARSRRQDLERSVAVGADAFVTKPFDGKALIAKIEELLSARHG